MQHELALHPPTSGAGRHRRERRRRRGRAAEEATDVIGGEVAPTQTRHERLPRGEGRRTQSVQRGASPLGYRSAGRATFGRRFSCGSRCRHASRLAGSVRPCRKLSTGPGRPRRVVTVESPELGGGFAAASPPPGPPTPKLGSFALSVRAAFRTPPNEPANNPCHRSPSWVEMLS